MLDFSTQEEKQKIEKELSKIEHDIPEEDILYAEELEKERKPHKERGYIKEGKPRKPRKQ